MDQENTPSNVTTLAATPNGGASSFITAAFAAGAKPNELADLYALYERERAWNAEAEANAALAEFHRIRPPIKRGTDGQFRTTRNGQSVPRKYASLEDIDRAVTAPLSEVGLACRWGETRVVDGCIIKACIVTHRGGYSWSADSPPVPITEITSNAGKSVTSAAQNVGIADTYACRYAKRAALGLSDVEDDTDGAVGDSTQGVTAVAPELAGLDQLAELNTLIVATEGDVEKLCDYFKVTEIGNLTVKQCVMAKAMLEKKIAALAAKAVTPA